MPSCAMLSLPTARICIRVFSPTWITKTTKGPCEDDTVCGGDENKCDLAGNLNDSINCAFSSGGSWICFVFRSGSATTSRPFRESRMILPSKSSERYNLTTSLNSYPKDTESVTASKRTSTDSHSQPTDFSSAKRRDSPIRFLSTFVWCRHHGLWETNRGWRRTSCRCGRRSRWCDGGWRDMGMLRLVRGCGRRQGVNWRAVDEIIEGRGICCRVQETVDVRRGCARRHPARSRPHTHRRVSRNSQRRHRRCSTVFLRCVFVVDVDNWRGGKVR